MHRVAGWRANLQKRLDGLTLNLDRCAKCGSPMVERKGKHGKFLGCADYPNCNHTQPVASLKRIATLTKDARAHLDSTQYQSGDRNGVTGMQIARALDQLKEAERTLRRAFP